MGSFFSTPSIPAAVYVSSPVEETSSDDSSKKTNSTTTVERNRKGLA